MSIRFEFFEAGCGDSIWIETENTNILIDGRFVATYNYHIQEGVHEPFQENGKKLDLVFYPKKNNNFSFFINFFLL